MFTIDYDHDTTFTRRLSVPLRVTLPTGQTIPTPEPTPPGKQRQYRLPLVDLEDNQGIQGKKRTYSAHDESESCKHFHNQRSLLLIWLSSRSFAHQNQQVRLDGYACQARASGQPYARGSP